MKTHKQQIIENTVVSLIAAGFPKNLADGFTLVLSNVYDYGYFEALSAVSSEKLLPAQTHKRGCSVCGIGANGEVMGYVCPRSDCPTRIT